MGLGGRFSSRMRGVQAHARRPLAAVRSEPHPKGTAMSSSRTEPTRASSESTGRDAPRARRSASNCQRIEAEPRRAVFLVRDDVEELDDAHVADVPAAIRKASRQHGFVWVSLVNPDEDVGHGGARDARDPSRRGSGCRLRSAAAEGAEVRGAPLRAAVADRRRRGIERHRARPDIPLHRRRVASDRSAHRRGRRRSPRTRDRVTRSNCATARSRRHT